MWMFSCTSHRWLPLATVAAEAARAASILFRSLPHHAIIVRYASHKTEMRCSPMVCLLLAHQLIQHNHLFTSASIAWGRPWQARIAKVRYLEQCTTKTGKQREW